MEVCTKTTSECVRVRSSLEVRRPREGQVQHPGLIVRRLLNVRVVSALVLSHVSSMYGALASNFRNDNGTLARVTYRSTQLDEYIVDGFAQLNACLRGFPLLRGSRTLPIYGNGTKSIKGGVIVSLYVKKTSTSAFLTLNSRGLLVRHLAMRGLFPLVNGNSSRHSRSYFGRSRVVASYGDLVYVGRCSWVSMGVPAVLPYSFDFSTRYLRVSGSSRAVGRSSRARL